jgi:hypothetical protein
MKSYETVTGTLGRVLFDIFSNEPWYENDVLQKIMTDPTSEEFDDLLRDALEKGSSPGKNILLLLSLRNYATHVCDPETPFFFENF